MNALMLRNKTSVTVGLSLVLFACSSDDTARDGVSIDEPMEAPAGSSSTTGEVPDDDTTDTSNGSATSTGQSDDGPMESTDGPAATDGSSGEPDDPCADIMCKPGQTCTDGACTFVGGICNANLTIEKDDPVCGECMVSNCCDVLIECFGDVTINDGPTNCGALTECLYDEMNNPESEFEACRLVTHVDQIQDCANAACPSGEAGLDAWLDVSTCRASSCFRQCS